jgi:hypothetical protein
MNTAPSERLLRTLTTRREVVKFSWATRYYSYLYTCHFVGRILIPTSILYAAIGRLLTKIN